MNSVSNVFPPLFESDMRKLWDIDAGLAEVENWSACRRPGTCFQTKNLTKAPSHNTTREQWLGHRFQGDVRTWVFLCWWPCCLFCASGIKGCHCWNEKQMLARNSPDCSSFFHARASNAASLHHSPSYFLSVSLSLLCTLLTCSFFLSSF